MGAICSANRTFDEFLDCCRSGNINHIRELVEFNAGLGDIINDGEETGLAIACERDDYDIVLYLMRQDELDVNKGITKVFTNVTASGNSKTQIQHTTPLFIACEKNHWKLVELLVSHLDIDVNDGISVHEGGRRIGNHRTPLTVAAEKRHYEIVKMLLKRDAIDPSRNDVYKVLQSASTLYYLCRDQTEDSLETLDMLLRMKKFRPRKNSLNPLFAAIEQGNKEVIKKLLYFPRTVELFINHGLKGGFWGKCPLYLALEKEKFEIAKLLIDFEKTNLNGHKKFRPLHLCCEKGFARMAKLMLKKYDRVNFNIPDEKNGQTPLHIASKKNNRVIVKLLMMNKRIIKSCEKKDDKGKLPIDLTTNEAIKLMISGNGEEDEGEFDLDSDSDDD